MFRRRRGWMSAITRKTSTSTRDACRSGRPVSPRWDVSDLDYYPLVLKAFRSAAGLSDAREAKVAEALRQLQPALRHLRKSYKHQSRSSTVSPGYSDSTAFAYLLAYVPGYIVQSRMAFDFAGVAAMQPSPRQIGFFCCGPCPEAVALVEILSGQLFSQSDELSLDLFDISDSNWRPVRRALLEAGCNQGRDDSPLRKVETYDFDIRQAPGRGTAEIIERLDIAMFQNYDNELGSDRGAANRTVEAIAQLLAPGSKLILSDLTYSVQTHKFLEDVLKEYGQVARKQSGHRGVKHRYPDRFMSSNLFDKQSDEVLTARVGHTANFLVLDRT